MGKVNLNINGRAYGLGCEDGEEERLMRLGQKLDARVMEMAELVGQVGDLQLMVMAGITLIDEMDEITGNVDAEVERRIGRLNAENERIAKARDKTENDAAKALIKAAERIESLSARLSDGAGGSE